MKFWSYFCGFQSKTVSLRDHAEVDARLTNFDHVHWASCWTVEPWFLRPFGRVLKAHNSKLLLEQYLGHIIIILSILLGLELGSEWENI